jgi:hypothetical protein
LSAKRFPSTASRVVTGILDAGFNSEQFDQAPEVWIPFQMDPQSTEGSCYCRVTGRLRPGITLAAAKAHLQVAAEEFRRAFPRLLGPRTGFGIQPLQESMAGDVRSTLLILVVAVGFVLLIACANVAGLMLASAAVRGREIAIRAAIGAGRFRIVRQLLLESALLSITAGVLGLMLGLAGIRSNSRALSELSAAGAPEHYQYSPYRRARLCGRRRLARPGLHRCCFIVNHTPVWPDSSTPGVPH